MPTNVEFLLPKFARDQWRTASPAGAGKITVISNADTFLKERGLLNVLDADFRAMAREAKPTLWAHAETFHQALAAEMERPDPAAEHFQRWAGLVVTVFQGDLEVVRLDRAALMTLDEDLSPPIEAGLPFDPSLVQWPPVLANLHAGGGLSVLRSGNAGTLLGGCYAPCLVFPALAEPTVAQDPTLERFVSQATGRVAPRLADLMPIYGGQGGFVQAFDAALTQLARQLGASQGVGSSPTAQRAIALLRRELAGRYAETSPLEKPALLERPASFLGYVYQNQADDPGAGNAGFWKFYPLRADAGGKTVLFIPDGIDPTLNRWAENRAFPGTADFTRLCDLSIRAGSASGVVEVLGKNRAVFQVPDDHQVLSLNPKAQLDQRVVLEALCCLEGNNALDSNLVDPIHTGLRTALGNRSDLTPLLPLHTNLLRLFPKAIAAPADMFSLSAGSVGETTSPEAQCKLKLPLPEGDASPFRTFTWRARLISWKLDDVQLPSADVWPCFRGHDKPRWSAYFVRMHYNGGKWALFFHGEDGIRDRAAAPPPVDADNPDLYTVDRLTSPPRLAEVISQNAADREPRGLVFLNRDRFRPAKTANAPWRVSVDFGTSNTSIALSTDDNEPVRTRILTIRPWADRLLYPAARRTPPPPYPGWFLQRGDHENYHRGFFPTLLGHRRAVSRDSGLQERLANPSKLTAADCAGLIGAFDMLGVAGDLALQVRDSETLSGEWGIEDNLKWPSPDGADDAEKDRRRRALRMAFLELMLLNLAAEAYAETGRLPGQYTFTYPLSMPEPEPSRYENTVRRAVELASELICPDSQQRGKVELNLVNESHAVYAAYLRARNAKGLAHRQRVVLIDMGGGSADYAVFTGVDPARRDKKTADICFLDSMVLAGNRYFSFLPDISADKEFGTFRDSWTALLPDLPAFFPQGPADLKNEDRIGSLRQFYTLRVVSMMADKIAGSAWAKDTNTLGNREVTVAEMLKQRVDHYAPGHWMRVLFNLVLTHGLLLAAAPIAGEPEPTAIHVVLAGNGWRMLPHAGVQHSEDRVVPLVRRLYEELSADLRAAVPAGGRQLAAAEITVRFMDGKMLEGVLEGSGVYSKDVVAAGGLLQDRPNAAATAAQGIIGFDLPVEPITGNGADASEAGAPIVLPWYTSMEPTVVDKLVVAQMPAAPPNGGSRSSRTRLIGLQAAHTLLEPSQGPQSVVQQLQALDLMKTGGFAGSSVKMLSGAQWGDWNTALYESTNDSLNQYGEASSERPQERTSIVCHIWEYPLLNRDLRRNLFLLMGGKA